MKKNLLIALCLFITVIQYVNAQKITLKGSVKDSINEILSYANVIAKPLDKSKRLQFAITDTEGNYRFLFNKGDSINIEISYLGYKTLTYLFIANKSTTKDFILEFSNEKLDEIVIEMPVTVKGDTTTYRTDKFTTGEERKLRNVLKKLPGVDVDKNGNVTVQGRKVTKMLVDGKKFFGGNSKLAVNNIPADAIDQVQVIDNYNEVSFLKNLSDSEEIAMNIKLKKDKNKFAFGDVEAGKGNEDFYKTHANLFYYSPKTNINFIGDLNNFGEKTFTFRDYLSFQGGANAVFSGNFDWKGGDFTQFLQNQDVLTSTQKFGALNITKVATSNLDVSGYLIFSNSDVESKLETLNDYTSFSEFRENTIDSKNTLVIGKLNLEYVPNQLEKIYSRTQVKTTKNTKNDNIFSTVLGDTDQVINNRDLDALYINQNFEWHKKTSIKHTFSGIANFVFNQSNQNVFWQTQDDLLDGLLPLVLGQQVTRINQTRNTDTFDLDVVLKHFWEINNENHIYTTLGNKYTRRTFLTNENQTLDSGTLNDFNSNGFGNDVTFGLNDFFVGLHYKFRTGVFTLKQGFNLHNFAWNVDQSNQLEKSKWLILPDFLAKIQITQSKKINFRYSLRSSFSDVAKFTNQFYLLSYNSIFKGDENLENNLRHNLSLNYTRFSMYRGLMLVLGANYSKQVKGVINTVNFQGNNQFLSNRLIDNSAENLLLSGNIDKRINKIKYRFNASYNSAYFFQEFDGVLGKNKNEDFSYEIGLETLYDDFPTIDVGIRKIIGRYTSNNVTSEFVLNEPFVTLDYDFLKGFILSFDYSRSNYKNEALNQKNTFEVANFKLSYRKEESAWSYNIMSNNIFNTKFKRDNSFSQYLISDTKTFILPRVIMLSVAYNL